MKAKPKAKWCSYFIQYYLTSHLYNHIELYSSFLLVCLFLRNLLLRKWTLNNCWLSKKCLQSRLSTFVCFEFLDCCIYSHFRKLIFYAQEFFKSFLINIFFPLEFIIICNVWLFKKLSSILIRKFVLFG